MKLLALILTVLTFTCACEDEKAGPEKRSVATDNEQLGDLEGGNEDAGGQPSEPVLGCGSNEGATFNGLSCEEAKASYDKAVVDCIESGKFFDLAAVSADSSGCSNIDLSSEDCSPEALRAKHEGDNLDSLETLLGQEYTILACLEKDSGLSEYFIYTAAGTTSDGKISFNMNCTVYGTADNPAEYSDTCKANQ